MGKCTVCGKDFCNHGRYSIFIPHGEVKWHWRCRDCGDSGEGINPVQYFVPMYEGKVVDPDTHEWAGFEACNECSEKEDTHD